MGYSTRSMSINEIDIADSLGNLLSAKTVFYVADNLYYPVPEKYSGNAELLMVQKGKIVLGADLYLSPETYNFQFDEEDEKRINETNYVLVEAQRVVAKKINANEFFIPVDYKIRSRYEFAPAIDSTMIDSITVTVPHKEQKEVPKKKSKGNPKRPIKKQSAICRKEE